MGSSVFEMLLTQIEMMFLASWRRLISPNEGSLDLHQQNLNEVCRKFLLLCRFLQLSTNFSFLILCTAAGE